MIVSLWLFANPSDVAPLLGYPCLFTSFTNELGKSGVLIEFLFCAFVGVKGLITVEKSSPINRV